MAQPSKRISELNLAVIDLPDLVQSLANQGRSGVLQIDDPHHSRWFRFVFSGGLVCAGDADDGTGLYHALRWLQLMDEERFVATGVPDHEAFGDRELAQHLTACRAIDLDGLRDAIDILIEQRFTALFGHRDLSLSFAEGDTDDPWLAFQIELGTAINPNSLLMEAVRLQDERSRFGEVDIGDQDMLVPTQEAGELDSDSAEAHLLAGWRDHASVATNLLDSGLPPAAARLALLALHNQQLLHKSSVAELLVIADRLKNDGLDREREMVLRQAARLGGKNPRIHLQLAYLAELRRDVHAAAEDHLIGGRLLVHQNPRVAIKALNKAREFGADRQACLQALLACHQSLGDQESACTILLQMADCYEKNGDTEQAIQAVHEAQEMGADAVACALSLARLQMHGSDPEQALLQLQTAAHLAVQEQRLDAAAIAWEKILTLQPANAEIALLLATQHVRQQETDQAVAVIRTSLRQGDEGRIDEWVIGLRELLAQLDPEDADNHHHLAAIYQKRKDVDNAADQLLLVARNQEQREQWPELAATLERILAIDPQRRAQHIRLAEVLFQLGLTTRSAEAWNQAVQTALDQGLIAEARDICRRAIDQHPAAAVLHAQLAAIAFREANQPLAIKHGQRAAHLALGGEDFELAKSMLNQLVALKPDDLYIRHQLTQACVMTRDPKIDELLHGLIRLAVGSDNLGIAIEHAYQRVLLAPPPAYTQRAELVELLRRANRTREELDEGQSLFQNLIEDGEFQQALELQQRLVASNSDNGELVMNLGEVFEALDQHGQAIRCYRLATVLFQQEGNDERTTDMLQRLSDLTRNAPDITRAHNEHAAGRAINWEAIRHDLAAASKQQIIDGAQAGKPRPGTDTYSQKLRSPAR